LGSLHSPIGESRRSHEPHIEIPPLPLSSVICGIKKANGCIPMSGNVFPSFQDGGDEGDRGNQRDSFPNFPISLSKSDY
jgi:hypothetical protein